MSSRNADAAQPGVADTPVVTNTLAQSIWDMLRRPSRSALFATSLGGTISATYSDQLLIAVSRATIDELFAAGWYPYSGCALTVREVGWDEVMSSEVAIYNAARGALSELRLVGSWELCA